MILLAEGLFRLDVVISGDTLRTVVRNLSSGKDFRARVAGKGQVIAGDTVQ